MDSKIVKYLFQGLRADLRRNIIKVKNIATALVLHPHPQYGGTMNNKVVVDTFHTFMENDFSVCRVNFRGVEKVTEILIMAKEN